MVQGIHEKSTFAGFDRESLRFNSGPLSVVRSRRSSDLCVEVAFAVPRKVGSAVVRNRLRRQIRAVIDELMKESAVPNGSYLVVVRPQARGAAYSELRSWMASAFSRMSSRV